MEVWGENNKFTLCIRTYEVFNCLFSLMQSVERLHLSQQQKKVFTAWPIYQYYKEELYSNGSAME